MASVRLSILARFEARGVVSAVFNSCLENRNRKLAEKVAAAGFFVAVRDFLKGDSYVPSDANRHIKVRIQDHSTVGSSLFYSNLVVLNNLNSYYYVILIICAFDLELTFFLVS
ncbi:hypothetical protein F8388_000117 [Cannabis sativa]|uniref:Uncharacterized protein n=1 Tax=Cannabis sativa TaxID=3483 RepID=A0A7J6FQ82_CANSA|nr:hypothetical protein F8388_000117 [Cannabis sativa]